MIKNYKKIILVIFIVSVFFISNSAQAQAQAQAQASTTTTVTDPVDDVTLVNTKQGNNGVPNVYTQTVTNEPNIDILSASYKANTNGSVTVSLTVKGKIESDNHTYYQIQLVENYLNYLTNVSRVTIITVLYTASFSVNFLPGSPRDTQFSYANGSNLSFGPMHSYVNGQTLTATLEPHITTSENNNYTVTLPKSFPENPGNNTGDTNSTAWHIKTWHGNNITDAYGIQYFDYYPNTDNSYVNNTKYTTLTNTPGFEIFSILAIPVIIAVKKKFKP